MRYETCKLEYNSIEMQLQEWGTSVLPESGLTIWFCDTAVRENSIRRQM